MVSLRMKTTVVLTTIFVVCVAVPIIDDKVVLERTEQIHKLLKHINQPTHFSDFVETAVKFKREQKSYTDVEKFLQLPRGQIFSVFIENHLTQAIELFKWFFWADNFSDFFEKAIWARLYVNEGMFVYSFQLAVIHKWCTTCTLPPIYETNPYYFFGAEVIQEAQTLKQIHGGYSPPEGFTIMSNYSEDVNLDPEQKMSYFTEDVQLNSFYYDYNLRYPFWMDREEFGLSNDRRGELFSFVHQQLSARNRLERLSNGFGNVENIHFDWPIKAGYYPSLRYPNGLGFPSRANRIELGKYWEFSNPHYNNFISAYTYVLDFARRIRDAIGVRYAITNDGKTVSFNDENGLEILTSMLEGNPTSPNLDFYRNLQTYFRKLLGYTYTPFHRRIETPSAFEHYETSLRDPISWQFFDWLVGNVHEYESQLPSYTNQELELEGVQITNVEVDNLITYFDRFDADLGQAVSCNEAECIENTFNVNVQQERLNHEPFTVSIDVNVDKPVEVIGKLFMGPKQDQYQRKIDIDSNRLNFVELDKFTYTLVPGSKTIERNSREFYSPINRNISSYGVNNQILSSLNTDKKPASDDSEFPWQLPYSLILPKGTESGQPFQLYVILYEVKNKSNRNINWNDDRKSLRYPFDRMIDENTFKVPNSYFKDVTIYHKND